jgi:sirohydrochlorin ferrochelatase
MAMKTLILLAHGSRHPATPEEVATLALKVAVATKCSVSHAFLEINRPSLSEAISQAIAEGAELVNVLPLFVNTGNHLVRDLPRLVADARIQHPHVEIGLLHHVGAHSAYTAVIETIAREAGH